MKRKLTILALAVGLMGALVAVAGVASGSVSGSKLDLRANDTDGDRFVLIQDGTVTHTQTLTKQGACGITSSGPDELVALDATANPNNPAPGLKDHIFGVTAQGEGNGTPCSRIDGNTSGRGEQLIIELAGPIIGGWYADYAQFGIKLKFGATGTIQALLDGEDVDGLSDTKICSGDCGPDSGDDRKVFILDAGEGELFNGVRISVDSPADGALSLLDDPDAGFDTYFMLAPDNTPPVITVTPDPFWPVVVIDGEEVLAVKLDGVYEDAGATAWDDFDGDRTEFIETSSDVDTTELGRYTVTYTVSDSSGNEATATRLVEVFDGILNCGEETDLVGRTTAMDGIFKRLDNVDGSTCSRKPYTLNESVDEEFLEFGSTILFDPQGGQQAAYSGIVSGEKKQGDNPTGSTLSYDPDGGFDFEDMLWCVDAAIGGDGYVTSATLPYTPATDDDPEETESWCIAAETTVTVGGGQVRTTWTVYGHDDPRMSGA